MSLPPPPGGGKISVGLPLLLKLGPLGELLVFCVLGELNYLPSNIRRSIMLFYLLGKDGVQI